MKAHRKTTLVSFLVVCSTYILLANARTFTMGYLTGSERLPGNNNYPRPGLTISGAISLAVDEINKYKPLVQGHQLNFTVSETYGEEEISIYQVAALWTQKVSVYIGPQETCVHEAKMASGFNLPMISYFCARRETSDKTQFPTFARTRPPDTQISRSVASLLLTFNWKKVALLYSDNQEGNFRDVSRTIVSTLDDAGIQVRYLGTWSYTYHHGYGENPFDALVSESYQEARIYVILGYYFEHLGLMMSLQNKGLLDKGEYFVVGVDIEQYETQDPTRYLKGLLRDEIEEEAEKAFQSYLGVVASPPKNTDDFAMKVNEYMQLPPFNFPNPIRGLGGMKKVPAEGAYLYDAVNIYARALNECLLNGEDPFDGRGLMKYITERTYLSAMGYYVFMDENGDAEGNYTLIGRKEIPGSPGKYGLFPVAVFQLLENRSHVQDLEFFSDIQWVSGVPPEDEPGCGFHGEKCIMWKLAIFIFGVIVTILLLALLISYKHCAYEQELDSLLWKIDYKDIEINEYTPTTNSKNSKNVHPLIRTSQVSLSSNVEGDFRYSSIYTSVGIYKGRLLAVKRLRKKSVDITRKMKKELKVMRDLRHDNLNPFIGACIEPPNICIITEYCSRGSLKDVLENEDVKLDNMFNASLIGDIIRGMTYLHDSALRSHGNLKSSNCLIDSRWVVKITDFGLHELKFGADCFQEDDLDFEHQCEKLLWTAPELLRNPNPPPGGTQKGDIYSFGILLHEIIGRKGPYGQINMAPSEIIKRILEKDKQSSFRPNVAKLQASFDCVIECMQECWNEDPENRPDFKSIRTKLRPMRRGMKPHIFDNMLAMMEKYANNLEALVDERTDQLIEEKKKTDALLYEMLPKYVADQLKRGHKVEAESFDCVTIYFSDIVGFTTMSAQSSPLEVVDFLNDLYTCFDSIIENYDVYKVETIGDAYMVVSGLPEKNGDNHASEIASMALHLLQDVRKFKIRHRPSDETLMLRIGIHSGAVCAGVVGKKMPRYCLFGDTVNTASRMESSGQPLRIHCSESFKLLLDNLGGYEVEDRGFVNIKGKGEMHTYWLTGQDNSRKKKLAATKSDQTVDLPKTATTTRSSLKHSNKIADSHRMSFQESPKKLRFAPGNSLTVCDNCNQSSDEVRLDDSLNDCSFGQKSAALLALSRWCLISKRNSCPCLLDNCDIYCEIKYSSGGRTVLPTANNYPHVILPDISFQREWEKVGRLASFVSCLEEKYVVVYDKLGKKSSNISHSESEPFLTGMNGSYRANINE